MAAMLAHSIGLSNAALMIMSGDLIDAQRALQWGLVSEVVEPEALMDRARELAATIASRAPIAAETAKLNLPAAVSMPLDKAMENERHLPAICRLAERAGGKECVIQCRSRWWRQPKKK